MKTKQYIVILLFLLIESQSIFGTNQISDYLIYKGDTLQIQSSPLEEYFENHIRPESVFEELGISSTACGRGYIAYWELRNDSLFLNRLEGDTIDIKLSLIFTDREVGKEVFADWYNQSAFNQYGKNLFGYISFFEYEREFVFRQGILFQIKTYDNTGSRRSEFTKNPELLKEHIAKSIDYSNIAHPEKRTKVFVQIIKVNEMGKIDSVSILRGSDSQRNKEALRVVKAIPEWDVLYRRGKIFNMRWTIPVIFGNDE